MPLARCPECGLRQVVRRELTGLLVDCRSCGAEFRAADPPGPSDRPDPIDVRGGAATVLKSAALLAALVVLVGAGVAGGVRLLKPPAAGRAVPVLTAAGGSAPDARLDGGVAELTTAELASRLAENPVRVKADYEGKRLAVKGWLRGIGQAGGEDVFTAPLVFYPPTGAANVNMPVAIAGFRDTAEAAKLRNEHVCVVEGTATVQQVRINVVVGDVPQWVVLLKEPRVRSVEPLRAE